MNFCLHVFRQTYRNIRGSLFPNLTTVGIIAVCMLIFSSFTLIAYNLGSFLKIWEEKIEVVAYLKKEVVLGDIETLMTQVRRLPGIERVTYISPFDAMSFMESKLGSQKGLLEGVRPGVLPASFEIQPTADHRTPAKIKELALALKKFPQIEEVQYGEEWVEAFSGFLRVVQKTQWILGGLLLLAIIFIISNTLQLVISSRREEIEVMRLVGARWAFIQVPFYVEGLLQGLIGTGVALFFLFLLHRGLFLYTPLPAASWLSRGAIFFLSTETIGWIIAGGMILGLFGSLVASMKLLR